MAEEVKAQGLGDILNDISDFITLKDGESFEGVFVSAMKVQSRFDPEQESIEMTFNVNGKDKTTSGVRLARMILDAGVVEGGKVKVTRVSTKGTKVEWKVEKVKEGK